MFFGLFSGKSIGIVTSSLPKVLTRFLTRFLTRVSGRGKIINKVYSTTGPYGKTLQTLNIQQKTSNTLQPPKPLNPFKNMLKPLKKGLTAQPFRRGQINHPEQTTQLTARWELFFLVFRSSS